MKNIFISFDYDNDKHYKHLLNAMKNNSRFDITFIDKSSSEIQSSDIGRVKAALTTKIKSATHTLVIVGEYANTYHSDYKLIGNVNWQWWEIEKSKELGKNLIAVKIERKFASPEPLKSAGATWANSFNVDAIQKAIDDS